MTSCDLIDDIWSLNDKSHSIWPHWWPLNCWVSTTCQTLFDLIDDIMWPHCWPLNCWSHDVVVECLMLTYFALTSSRLSTHSGLTGVIDWRHSVLMSQASSVTTWLCHMMTSTPSHNCHICLEICFLCPIQQDPLWLDDVLMVSWYKRQTMSCIIYGKTLLCNAVTKLWLKCVKVIKN